MPAPIKQRFNQRGHLAELLNGISIHGGYIHAKKIENQDNLLEIEGTEQQIQYVRDNIAVFENYIRKNDLN